MFRAVLRPTSANLVCAVLAASVASTLPNAVTAQATQEIAREIVDQVRRASRDAFGRSPIASDIPFGMGRPYLIDPVVGIGGGAVEARSIFEPGSVFNEIEIETTSVAPFIAGSTNRWRAGVGAGPTTLTLRTKEDDPTQPDRTLAIETEFEGHQATAFFEYDLTDPTLRTNVWTFSAALLGTLADRRMQSPASDFNRGSAFISDGEDYLGSLIVSAFRRQTSAWWETSGLPGTLRYDFGGEAAATLLEVEGVRVRQYSITPSAAVAYAQQPAFGRLFVSADVSRQLSDGQTVANNVDVAVGGVAGLRWRDGNWGLSGFVNYVIEREDADERAATGSVGGSVSYAFGPEMRLELTAQTRAFGDDEGVTSVFGGLTYAPTFD